MTQTSNNIGILTSSSSVHEIEKFYYAPISYYADTRNIISNLYCFLSYDSSIAEFDISGNTTTTPVETAKSIKEYHKNIFAVKRILDSDISPVIQRINWKTDTYYDIYKDNEFMFHRDSDGKLIKNFYIINKYNQVFKCLWNAKNSDEHYDVSSISKSNNVVSIYHSGPDVFQIGDYITLDNVNPSEYNGTYVVVDGSYGIANVSYALNTSYSVSANSNYTSNGIIYYASLSTEEPQLDVGTFDNSVTLYTADGYKWKYIYTVDKGQKERFYTKDYIPVPISVDTPPNSYITESGAGSLDIIGVSYGGNAYSDGTTTTTVNITGDGQGANAVAYVVGGSVYDVIITNAGSNYTTANAVIVPSFGQGGSGAILELYPSPIGGHGFDPIAEFGCNSIMVSAQFFGSEGGTIPTDVYYNQIGLLINPYAKKDPDNHANSTIFLTSTILSVSATISPFTQGEILIQGESINNYIFKAECLSYDAINNVLYVVNTQGTATPNYAVRGLSSGGYSIVSGFTSPTISPYTGYITYIENIPTAIRNPSDTEQFNLIIKY
jgi:hypothetical protein